MSNLNPFLNVKLYRTDKDQERIDKEKADLQAGRLSVSYTLYHGWFSQSQADEENSYEEWKNMNGDTVAVTTVVDRPTSNKPVPDARYVGTLSEKIRRVTLEGKEIVNRNITILGPNTNILISQAGSVRDAIAKSGMLLTSNASYSVRVERIGETVFEGSYSTALNYVFDDTSSYTIILKILEEPKSIAEKETKDLSINYTEKLYKVLNNSSLRSFLGSPLPTKIYSFNGMNIDDPENFRFTVSGTLTVKEKSAEFKSDTIFKYVNEKLGSIKNTEFTAIKDPEGNLCQTQAQYDNSIKTYYKTYRSGATFKKGTIKELDHNLHIQAKRKWPLGSIIIAAHFPSNIWVPVCTKDEWDRILGVDVSDW
jgi:hypothetical protein